MEKAHPDVFNVLLQVLDDGRITDSQGRTVDFKNTIIIMTSNLDKDDLRTHFRPEFINRLDEIIEFSSLGQEHLKGIIDLMMADLNKRLVDRELHVSLTERAKEHIAEAGYDPVYGARPLKRYLQKHVETLSARLILADKVKMGDTITIDYDGEKLIANV